MKSMLSFILNFPYQSYKHKPLFNICSKRANVPKVCLQGLVSRLLDKIFGPVTGYQESAPDRTVSNCFAALRFWTSKDCLNKKFEILA